MEECRRTITAARKALEDARCMEAEAEASLVWSASVLQHSDQPSITLKEDMPGALQDSWMVWSSQFESNPTKTNSDETVLSLGSGMRRKRLYTQTLAKGLSHSHELSKKIEQERKNGNLQERVQRAQKSSTNEWMTIFDEQVYQLQQYHTQNTVSTSKRMRMGNPVSDGYDLVEAVLQHAVKDDDENDDTVFSRDQVLGKYLDCRKIHQKHVLSSKKLSAVFPEDYGDFLQAIGNLPELSEEGKLKDAKAYAEILEDIGSNLEQFLKATEPLLVLDDLTKEPAKELEESWKEGGYAGYAKDPNDIVIPMDLQSYQSIEELQKKHTPQELSKELTRRNLKAGGSPLERAQRLWTIRDLTEIPRKLVASKPKWTRYALCRLETRVNALVQYLRPTLERTIAKVARASAQTPREAQLEYEQDMYGDNEQKGGENDEDEDEPIYNPKNVPLDWDGKPIPYWLFKLHGLQHYFSCEICGGESYRGRHQFEIHFGDPKHAFGLASLGIPNTQHFHGITKIKDAQELYAKLQESLKKDQFDANRDEEYEDSQGNVLSRKTYEDLGRQGLL